VARGSRRGGGRPSTPAEVEDGTARKGNARLVTQRQESWSGPLPPPQALQAFEDIAPGTAAKIIEEFQAEAAHRRSQENAQLRLVAAETLIGQVSAILFALGGLAVTAYAAFVGAEWIGSIVGGGMIVSGVIALRAGRGTENGEGKKQK
jgi:uncharacterized membrane protein